MVLASRAAPIPYESGAWLAQRTRVGLWLCLTSITLFALVDPFVNAHVLGKLYAVKAFQVAVAIATFRVLRGPRHQTDRHPRHHDRGDRVRGDDRDLRRHHQRQRHHARAPDRAGHGHGDPATVGRGPAAGGPGDHRGKHHGEHLDRPRSRRADVAAAGNHHGILRVRVCRACQLPLPARAPARGGGRGGAAGTAAPGRARARGPAEHARRHGRGPGARDQPAPVGDRELRQRQRAAHPRRRRRAGSPPRDRGRDRRRGAARRGDPAPHPRVRAQRRGQPGERRSEPARARGAALRRGRGARPGHRAAARSSRRSGSTSRSTRSSSSR